jgi:hypothetical protein
LEVEGDFVAHIRVGAKRDRSKIILGRGKEGQVENNSKKLLNYCLILEPLKSDLGTSLNPL